MTRGPNRVPTAIETCREAARDHQWLARRPHAPIALSEGRDRRDGMSVARGARFRTAARLPRACPAG